MRDRLAALMEKYPGQRNIPEYAVKGLFRELGFATPKGRYVGRGEELPADLELAYPLVAKVVAPALAGKSDVGGVKTGIRRRGELLRAVSDLLRIDGAAGVLIEETAPPGVEVVMGGVMDPQFGPLVMFGLGGVFVEIFQDVAFALAPLTRDDADWLIRQVRGYRLLQGYRGRPPVTKNVVTDLLMAVSELIATGLIAELDLNPVTLYPDGASILDGKIFITS